MLETLKNEAPPTRKHDLGISEGTYFRDFRHMFRGQFYDPHVIDVLSNFETLGPTFWRHIFRSQKLPEFFFSAPGWRPSSTPPGEGGNWEASESNWEASVRHLGGKEPEEAQRRLGRKKLIDICSQMGKFLLFSNSR